MRAVFWVMAAACFAAASALLFSRAAFVMADRWAHEATGVAIVRILAADAPGALAEAEDAIKSAPSVARAQIVTAERAAALMQDWQGAQVRPSDLPPLQLVEVDFAPGAPRAAAQNLEAHLAEKGLAVQVVSPRSAETEAARNAQLMRLAALVGAGFIVAMMAAVIAFSARALALRRADLITALTDIGATRERAGAELGVEAGRLGLWAGLAGALVAAGAGAAGIYLTTPTATPLSILNATGPIEWAALAATPLYAALFASLGARAGAGAVHARAARLA
jgi:cell division transport system permease protein